MKTRFEYDYSSRDKDFEKVVLDMAKHHWVYNDEVEEFHLELEKEFNLNEGERVIIEGIGVALITYKAVDISENIIIYAIEEE